MKIITVNLPVPYLQAIDKLVGNHGFYPSRSELIRVAVKEFLVKELEDAKSLQHYENIKHNNSEPETQPEINADMFVKVPINSDSCGNFQYKTFRIIHK